MPESNTFTRLERLRHAHEFKRVFQRGRCFRDDAMRIHFLENGEGHPRLGLVVSKKVGNSVVRSRVKRRMRHAFRERKRRIAMPLDLVFVANPKHGEATFQRYREALERFIEWSEERLRP